MKSGQWNSAAVVWATIIGAGIASAQDPARAPKPDNGTRQAPEAEEPKGAKQERGRGERIPDKLEVGDLAPDFTLKSLDGPETTTLSSFRGKRPVVLIFGSYT